MFIYPLERQSAEKIFWRMTTIISSKTTLLGSPYTYRPRVGQSFSFTHLVKYSRSTVPAAPSSESSFLSTVTQAHSINPLTSAAAINVYRTQFLYHSFKLTPPEFLRPHPLRLLAALRSLCVSSTVISRSGSPWSNRASAS